MPKGILERMSEGVVLGDGGYLFELERRGYIQPGPLVPEVNLARPEALAELNRAAVRIVREVASEGEVLVADNLSETWSYDPQDPASGRHVREMLDRQLAIMTEEGVAFVIAETFLWAMQEDHNSMGWSAGRKLRQVLGNLERILAVEALCAAQALELRAPLRTAPATGAVVERIRREVPFLGGDRFLAPTERGRGARPNR